MPRVSRSFVPFIPLFLLFFTLSCSGDASVGPPSAEEISQEVAAGQVNELTDFQLVVGETAFFEVGISRYQTLMKFRSSTPSVARVSSSGVITAVAPGSTTITASFGWYYVVVRVDVTEQAQKSLTALTMYPATVSLGVDETQQFSASATWSDGGTALPALDYTTTGGTVSATGLYTAPSAAGTYQVVVAHRDGSLKDTSVVTVTADPAGDSPAGGDAFTLHPGETAFFAVDVTRYQTKMSFVSSKPSVATVSASGIVTAIADGNATVTASFGWYVVEKAVVVSSGDAPPPPELTALEMTPSASTLSVNGVQQFSVAADWSNGDTILPPLTYTASAGTVSSTGKYSAPSTPGTYQVVVAHLNGVLRDTSVVTVLADTPKSTPGDHGSFQLRSGESVFFAVDITRYQANMKFSTSKASVATVSSAGMVKAVGAGTATVKAAFGWYVVEKLVVVTSGSSTTPPSAPPAEPELVSIELTPGAVTLTAGAKQQFTLAAVWSNGETTVPPVSFAAAGATITSSGLFTAPSTAGTYRVVVTQTGGTLRDTAVVTVQAAPGGGTTNGSGGGANGVQPFFQDDFETGTMRDANGFSWTRSEFAYVRTDMAHAGNYALKFRYSAAAVGKDSFSEQRFDLGRDLTKLWVEYYLYVPANFEMRSGSSANNKFFSIFATKYSKVGDVQVVAEYERSGPDTSTVRMLSMSGKANVAAKKHATPLATSMRGKWLRIRLQFETSTGAGRNDGVIKLWRDDTLIYSHEQMDIWFAGGRNYWRNGYLLGWANTGFTQETSFFVDDVKFFDKNPGWQ